MDKDVNNKKIFEYINKKKKYKRRKKRILIIAILTIGLLLFLTKSPIFNINTFEVKGTSKISTDNIIQRVESFKGENILLFKEDALVKKVKEDKYIKDVKVKRKGIATVLLEITEEAPVYYIKEGKNNKIISEDLVVLEENGDIEGKNFVEIKGVENAENTKVGDKVSSDISKAKILKSFYPYITQNKEELKIESINIQNFVKIELQMRNIKINFGDTTRINEKMESVYSIMLSDKIKLTKGYIDVSFDGPPVINTN